ncbi:dTMP kinase [Streptomyces sp. NPDC057900]|uniref:dTMP kinase n=1 Tax=Streptomyces sp. NPDC057900 TaxID=3346274 RepID=UPI0036E715C7
MSGHGRFITVDGPGAVGKTTTVPLLARLLRERGDTVHTTAEPSTSPLGAFTRAHASELQGRALACLVAANRYEHMESELHPHLYAGRSVVCDRYLASTLVLQRIDGVPLEFLLHLNDAVLLPDLAVVLTASPDVIAARLARRGARHRFHEDPAAPARESALYREAARVLRGLGVPVLTLDTGDISPSEAAGRIAAAVPRSPIASVRPIRPDESAR